MKELRKLPVMLTETEMTERRDRLAAREQELIAVEAEKKETMGEFRERMKPIKADLASLSLAIVKRSEDREVDCEWRDSLVNGQLELVRLDTLEVIERETSDEAAADAAQPSLFGGARPTAPTLVCSALNDDGEAWSITAEQADAAERAIAESGSARVEVDGDTHTVTRVARGKACGTCGIVGGHHRPECAELQADGGNEPEDDGDPGGYDPNDAAAVAAKIAEGPTPPDGPVRGYSAADATAKPKRSKKAKAEEAEGVH